MPTTKQPEPEPAEFDDNDKVVIGKARDLLDQIVTMLEGTNEDVRLQSDDLGEALASLETARGYLDAVLGEDAEG